MSVGDRQVCRAIVSFSPNEMIGDLYYSPVRATDKGLFSFFLLAALSVVK